MKYWILIIAVIVPMTFSFSGCRSAATEEEKAAFDQGVYGQENQVDKEEFDDAIDQDYEPSVGDPPAWEMPAD